ncbi:MAG: hypothetical protein D3X82_00630 [Candidatus Leucobacter sulfamidivorax]|nr:hypothetical protein [Candidatus Leucobacter sulfamidivorax]
MSALPGVSGLTCLDTNVLLRAFLNDDPEQSPRAQQFQSDGAVTFDRRAARCLGWRLLDAEAAAV